MNNIPLYCTLMRKHRWLYYIGNQEHLTPKEVADIMQGFIDVYFKDTNYLGIGTQLHHILPYTYVSFVLGYHEPNTAFCNRECFITPKAIYIRYEDYTERKARGHDKCTVDEVATILRDMLTDLHTLKINLVELFTYIKSVNLEEL